MCCIYESREKSKSLWSLWKQHYFLCQHQFWLWIFFIKSPTQLFFHAILLIYHFLVYQFRPYQTYVKFKEIYACILFLSRISKLADWRIYFQVNAAERWKISLHWLWLNSEYKGTKELTFFDVGIFWHCYTIYSVYHFWAQMS